MTKKRAISLAITLVLSMLGGGAALSQANLHPLDISVQPGFYRVTHATDGDTFNVDMDGREEKIRLIGVDTPETKKPNSPVQCFGPEASDFAKQHIDGKSVRLEADPTGDNRDRYNRLLRYAYMEDGTLLNKKLIEEGYGFAYLSFQFQKQADFAAAQAHAKDANKGLWAVCQPKLNDGRWRSNDLQ